MRAAIVDKSGAVTAAVELQAGWNEPESGRAYWQPPTGCTVVLSDDAGIGWSYDGKTFTPPRPDTTPDLLPAASRDLAAEIDAMKAELVGKGVLSAKA